MWPKVAGHRQLGRCGLAAASVALVMCALTPAARADFSWSEAFVLNGGASVACPSSTECVGIGQSGAQSGDEVTFNPQSASSRSDATVDSGGSLFDLACPSTTQCTALDLAGQEVTFNPQAPDGSSPVPIYYQSTASGNGLKSIACPSAAQCTAVDSQGEEITFDPQAPGSAATYDIDGSAALAAVACPSTSQCTALDSSNDRAVTFDPTSPYEAQATQIAPNGDTVDAIACVSTSQCTVAGAESNADDFEVTFNPTAVSQLAIVPIAGTDGGPDDLACPSGTQCTIEDQIHESTFNPQSPGQPSSKAFDDSSGGAPGGHWISCPLSTECVTIDVNGRVDVGIPSAGGTGGRRVGHRKTRCRVPNVKGKRLIPAEDAIYRADCTVGKVARTTAADVSKGRVVSQSPSAGRTLPAGSKVRLVVSSGSLS